MRHRILLLVVASAAFGSCTTMYKSGQTPDDVYYSPGREIPAYVETKKDPEETAKRSEDNSDAYLRMKTYDRNRWSSFDNDYMYWNDWRWNNQMYYNTLNPHSVGYGTGYYGSSWSVGMSSGWGSPYYGYYSPFCPGYYGTPVIIVNPKPYNPRAFSPRNGSLSAYNNNRSFTDPHTGAKTYNIGSPNSAPVRSFSSGSSNRGSSTGGYYNSNSGSSRPRLFQSESSSSSPTRSVDRSTNTGSTNSSGSTRSSSGSSSSGGGSAPVRSFPKGGGR